MDLSNSLTSVINLDIAMRILIILDRLVSSGHVGCDIISFLPSKRTHLVLVHYIEYTVMSKLMPKNQRDNLLTATAEIIKTYILIQGLIFTIRSYSLYHSNTLCLVSE